MKKRFALCIKDQEADKLRRAQPLNMVWIHIRDCLGSRTIVGTVLVVHSTVHGKLLLIKNKYHCPWVSGKPWNPPKDFFYNYDVIPMWVSECGQSGILANTYPPSCERGIPMDPDYVAAKALLDAQIEQDRREADSCWAD